MATRYDIHFTGRVQGVFFRATTRRVASGLAVTGWVRDEADGSVRCVVEGDRAELDRFVTAVQQAKRANIEDTRITERAATAEFGDFSIR